MVDMMKKRLSIVLALLLGVGFVSALPSYPQVQKADSVLDEKVTAFLDKMKNRWHDWNVPEEDGKILYNALDDEHVYELLKMGLEHVRE